MTTNREGKGGRGNGEGVEVDENYEADIQHINRTCDKYKMLSKKKRKHRMRQLFRWALMRNPSKAKP